MSVNAVNAADVQQPKKNNSGAAIGTGVGLGAVGAGAGYFLGGKTPSLEEVFSQEPDTFKASMDKAAEKDSAAAETLRKEMEAIGENADVKAKQTAADAKANEVKTAIEGRTDYENKATLDQAVTDKKTALDTKEVEVAKADGTEGTRKIKYAEAKTELEAAENEVKNLAADAAEDVKTAAKNKLETAKNNLAQFDTEANALKEAENAVFDAKKVKFEADEATKALREEAAKAADELTNARKGIIDKLKDKNTVTEAFGKIKKSLTEGKGKAMAIYGGIALAVGLLAGAMLGGKKEA